MIQEGYTKYKGKAFKIGHLYGWAIVVSGSQLIEDIKNAPDDQLSTVEAVNYVLKLESPMTHQIAQLTHKQASQFADIRDEIATSFDDVLQLKGGEWVNIPAMDAILKVVCRTSNRAFVGLPLCRDPDWIALTIQFTVDVMKGAIALHLFPDFVAPLVARFFTEPGSMKRGINHLQPIIEQRRRHLDEYGSDWPEKPNDMLSWIMEEAKGEERSVRNLTKRIMSINFGAIHDSSMFFTHALFYLAANPKYADQLREEIGSIVGEDGWSKTALAKMDKVDSFLKETFRIECVGFASMLRKALKDSTFSDGTVIPAGSYISVAAFHTHLDGEIYNNPMDFNPFRFVVEPGEEVKARNRLVSTSPEYMPFGHGRHACPGRFFAATVLKAMLAHLVMTYDVKFENEGVRPVNMVFGVVSSPNLKAKVMFRKRSM